MNIITLIGYIGSISFIVYLLYHLFQTTILKKKIKPGLPDMIYFIVLFLLIGIYVVSQKDYPLIILILGFMSWGVLGSIDRLKKK